MTIALDPPDPEDPAPPAGAGRGGCALGADGEFRLRVGDAGSGRVVEIARPFALIGRVAGADVQIEDRAVSARHVYLHLDRRGLFAVDLATRTGTRFGGAPRSAGW